MDSILRLTEVHCAIVNMAVHPGFIGLKSKHTIEVETGTQLWMRPAQGRISYTLSNYLHCLALWCEAGILYTLSTALPWHQCVLEALWGQER